MGLYFAVVKFKNKSEYSTILIMCLNVFSILLHIIYISQQYCICNIFIVFAFMSSVLIKFSFITTIFDYHEPFADWMLGMYHIGSESEIG